MGRLFLSHSSLDKPAVTRTAVDLMFHGFPVWLDKWEMHLGDLLRKEIKRGIGASDYFVLFLSPDSIRSTWVRDELTVALERERTLGRQFIIPVKVAQCDPPPEIQDRLWGDLSEVYLEGLERLVNRLRNLGLQAEPTGFRMVPIRFLENMHVDGVAFERWLRATLSSMPDPAPDDAYRIVVDYPEPYRRIRLFLLSALEGERRDSRGSGEWIRIAEQAYDQVQALESGLERAVALILALPRGPNRLTAETLATAVNGAAMLVAGMLLWRLSFPLAWKGKSDETFRRSCPLFPRLQPVGDALGDEEVAAGLLPIDNLSRCDLMLCDVWREDGDGRALETTKAFAPRYLYGALLARPNLTHELIPDHIARYVIPPVVIRHCLWGDPLPRQLADWRIGPV